MNIYLLEKRFNTVLAAICITGAAAGCKFSHLFDLFSIFEGLPFNANWVIPLDIFILAFQFGLFSRKYILLQFRRDCDLTGGWKGRTRDEAGVDDVKGKVQFKYDHAGQWPFHGTNAYCGAACVKGEPRAIVSGECRMDPSDHSKFQASWLSRIQNPRDGDLDVGAQDLYVSDLRVIDWDASGRPNLMVGTFKDPSNGSKPVTIKLERIETAKTANVRNLAESTS